MVGLGVFNSLNGDTRLGNDALVATVNVSNKTDLITATM